ncbi:MAG: GxxExxY protein [Verrucomicrobiota bacterium]
MKIGIDDALTERILAAAIAVHRELGPGFLESIYEEAMTYALAEHGLNFARQVNVPVRSRQHGVGEHRLDLLVEGKVVELKAISSFEDAHYAIVRSYLRATGLPCGLLLNFAAPIMQIKRIGPEYHPKP